MSKIEISRELYLLVKKGLDAKSLQDLQECDKEFQDFIAASNKNPHALFLYNEFRVSNAFRMPKTRPRILLGGFMGQSFPPIHFFGLSQVADVVMLKLGQSQDFGYHSVIQCDAQTSFQDILQKMPEGFLPDLYWDFQVESMHFIPVGIDNAPFPTVASVCHLFNFKAVEHICELFDFICPISKFFQKILEKKYPHKIIDMPFGLNWGAFDFLIQPGWEKSIDLCVIFRETASPIYPYRNAILEKCKQFNDKYGSRYSISIHNQFLPIEEYISILKRSRATINITGVHGSYNYRTIEAMCSGCMLFQFNWDNDFFENNFSELFTDGRHGVGFNLDNFDDKLLYYLEKPKLMQKIAKEAYAYVIQNYNYKVLFERLIKIVGEKQTDLTRKFDPQRSEHHVNMSYHYQNNGMNAFMPLKRIDENTDPRWIKYNNLMILSPYHPERSREFFIQALRCATHEVEWIIHWNFLAVSLENEEAGKQEIENFLSLLNNISPSPFEELKVAFKYFVNSSKFKKYHLGDHHDEYVLLNLELIKCSENPQKRADLYYKFVQKAAQYFLSQWADQVT